MRGGAAALRQCLGVLQSPGSHLLDDLIPRLFGNAVQLQMLGRRSSVLGNACARQLMTGQSRNGEDWVQAEISAFKRGVPVEEAVTPPSSWYTSPEILNLELEKIFERRWLAVGKNFGSVWSCIFVCIKATSQIEF